jgi:hypothetical protein
MPDIGTSRPADIYKDLFHLNNGNDGVDSTLRAIQSGNGTDTKVKVSSTQTEIDFGGGKSITPEIKGARYTLSSHIVEASGGEPAYPLLDFSAANVHHLTLADDVATIEFANVPASGIVGTIRLIIERATFTISSWPSGTIWNSGSALNLSSTTSNTTTIVDFMTVNGGTTWYAVIVASSMA